MGKGSGDGLDKSGSLLRGSMYGAFDWYGQDEYFAASAGM